MEPSLWNTLKSELSGLMSGAGRFGLFGAVVVSLLAVFKAPMLLMAAFSVIWLIILSWLAGNRPTAQARPGAEAVMSQTLTMTRHSDPLSYRSTLEAMPDPVLVIMAQSAEDKTSRFILAANPAAQRVLGAPAEGGLLVGAVRQPQLLEAVEAALFERRVREIEYVASGSQTQYWRAFAVPLSADLVTDGDRMAERPLAMLMLRDETDIRRIERMRADFLANASHELRSPLASLSGFIETLRTHARHDLDARDRFLSIMAAQADRMGRLITDLMSLSRIEMNEHVPPSGLADLALSVREVTEGLSLMAGERQVKFDLDCPRPGLYPILADRDQVMQVVQNLADNALKYAPDGSTIKVSLQINQTLDTATPPAHPGAGRLVLLKPDKAREGLYMRLSIRDQGPGINREYLPRLAERFYRVEGQKSGDRLGTGLGLAIVKHIVNRHRGGVVVESLGQSSAAGQKAKAGVVPVRSGPATFTEFSVYFPQERRLIEAEAGPVLMETEAAPQRPRARRASVHLR